MGIIVGVAILLIIGGIVGFGYYRVFVAPTQVLAARVGDTRYSQGDLVKRMRLLMADSLDQGQTFDYGTAPFEVLSEMAEAGIIRRSAPRFGIQVTESEVELALLLRFAPRVPEGQEVRPGQIEQEYTEKYQGFLNSRHLSDKDYRELVGERIYRTRLRGKLGEQVPSIGEQVEVHWVKLPSEFDTSGASSGAPSPELVRERLEEEGFENVAREVSVDRLYADGKGYVGWVPKDAFPSLDEPLFGSEEQDPIAHNEISEPIFTMEGSYILKVTAGPEEREISDVMKERLKDQVMDTWLLEQKTTGGQEGWWEMKFNSDIYAWAVDQVRQAFPRATPRSPGQ